MKIAICDDDLCFAEELKARIARLIAEKTEQISLFSSPQALSDALTRGDIPQIVFMDIQFREENGIDYVKNNFVAGSEIQIIYITSFLEYCSDVYETEHVYFLKKPFSDELLQKALEKAQSCVAQNRKTLLFHRKGGTTCFRIDEILYLESRYRKIVVHTQGAEQEFYGGMPAICERAGSSFIRCHKSFMVNPTHISVMESHYFELDNGSHVPISRSMLQQTRDAFFAYLGGTV